MARHSKLRQHGGTIHYLARDGAAVGVEAIGPSGVVRPAKELCLVVDACPRSMAWWTETLYVMEIIDAPDAGTKEIAKLYLATAAEGSSRRWL